MIISHKYKFIFIKTIKTAGTSIELYLSPFCSEDDIVTPINPEEKGHIARNYKGYSIPIFDLINSFPHAFKPSMRKIFKNGKYYSHIPANQIRAYLLKKVWNEYYKFCVDRNPWDKMVSLYHMVKYINNENLSFDDFIRYNHLQKNYPLYTSLTGKVIVDKILKYENLNKELSTTFSNLGIPFDGELTIKAKSHYRKDKRNYRDYYSDFSENVIYKRFRKEIDLLGYTF